MGITALELGAWIAIYLGLGLIRASLPSSRLETDEDDPRKQFGIPGYCLLVLGTLILGIEISRHFH
jgi:hypothetical protein